MCGFFGVSDKSLINWNKVDLEDVNERGEYQFPFSDSDVFIYPKFGDRLDNLAHKYYGDVSLWWVIAKANNLDAAHIGLEFDKQLRIPMEIDVILNQLTDMSY